MLDDEIIDLDEIVELAPEPLDIDDLDLDVEILDADLDFEFEDIGSKTDAKPTGILDSSPIERLDASDPKGMKMSGPNADADEDFLSSFVAGKKTGAAEGVVEPPREGAAAPVPKAAERGADAAKEFVSVVPDAPEPVAPEAASVASGPLDDALEALVGRIEARLLENIRAVVEAKLPEVVRTALREEIEKIKN